MHLKMMYACIVRFIHLLTFFTKTCVQGNSVDPDQTVVVQDKSDQGSH